MYQDEVRALINVFEQHKIFFGTRIPHLYEQLGVLVYRCRRLQRNGKRQQARQLLDGELCKIFGIAAACCDDRPLALLAGVMRHVLISGMRLQLPMANITRGNDAVNADVRKTLLALDTQLTLLSRSRPELVSLLEMRYFARLGIRDIACERSVVVDVIKDELRFARACMLHATGF